ncbi:MAG TPA: tetraacyldisaccharide 4'-kinase, partial [Limnobacter sp.]|nr:tetraacyldisaccharide 4'-kinase [Limnobacter sp.]
DRGRGNGGFLPAGPLREPLSRLNLADAVLASNLTCHALAEQLGMPEARHWHSVRVCLSGFKHAASGKTLGLEEARQQWQSTPVASFTGLGNPEKLFGALRQAGIVLNASLALPDHHDYPTGFCEQFEEQVLITSGKDAVKLWPHDPRLWIADIQVALPTPLTQALEDHIGRSTD